MNCLLLLYALLFMLCHVFTGRRAAPVANSEVNSKDAQKNLTLTQDFVTFLRTLGSKVYNSKIDRKLKQTVEYHHYLSTTESIEAKRFRSERMTKTQKSALQDLLMMKLVSYYENKYKLSGDAEEVTSPSNHVFGEDDGQVLHTDNILLMSHYDDDEDVVVV